MAGDFVIHIQLTLYAHWGVSNIMKHIVDMTPVAPMARRRRRVYRWSRDHHVTVGCNRYGGSTNRLRRPVVRMIELCLYSLTMTVSLTYIFCFVNIVTA